MKVLFLSAWYPTENDAMAGLFVQKHADAVVQQGADVKVLYSDKKGIRWCIDILRGWCKLYHEWGLPDVVQMNVLDKNGILARWLQIRYHIPYVIIEHWSGYLPMNFSFRGGWHKKVMQHIAQHASCILPVSQMLEDAMKQCGITNARWQRIHNVVDDFFYHPVSPVTIPLLPQGKLRLLHVSCFDEQAKNIQGLLRSVRKVASHRQDFELVMVGTGIDYQRDVDYAATLNFPDGMISFIGEQTPYEVAQWMQQSHMFLFFSRYENAPVVLSESIVTGLPIVTSNVGGIPEMVDNTCGILVPSENEHSFADAIEYLMDHLGELPKEGIQQQAKKYSYEVVGKQLMEIYQSIL